MATATVAASPADVLISIEYDSDSGIRWARLYDNPILAWNVDQTGVAESTPAIVGALPAAAGDTSPILSPQWATFHDPAVFVPDVWRGLLGDFLTWLATNNDAARVLQARFAVSSPLLNGFNEWAAKNPTLVFEGDPPPPPPPPGSLTSVGTVSS